MKGRKKNEGSSKERRDLAKRMLTDRSPEAERERLRELTMKDVKKLISAPLKVLPPITEKQAKCLQFIWDYYRENMYYPTQREVASAMNVQSNTAEMYLQPLTQKGYLQREPRKQRNIRLTSNALEKLSMMGVNVRE